MRGPSGPAPAAGPDHRLWETAVLFHLRDAFRAGDVWLARSRRYGDIRKALLSAPAGSGQSARLGSPSAGSLWTRGLRRLAAAARAGAVAGGRKPPCRTGPLTWSPTSTGGCPRRGRANSWPTSRVRPTRRRRRRRAVSPCRTVSRRSTPLGWEHINLTGGIPLAGRRPRRAPRNAYRRISPPPADDPPALAAPRPATGRGDHPPLTNAGLRAPGALRKSCLPRRTSAGCRRRRPRPAAGA